MEQIDLHMHSIYSDGTDTPGEIVLRAKKDGIGLIALTDHNTLAGIDEFRKACQKHEQIGVEGIELTTGYMDPHASPRAGHVEIHVLGYFLPEADFSDPQYDLIQKAITEYKDSKTRHNEAMVQKMHDAGIGNGSVTVEGFRDFARTLSPSGNYNRVHIAKYLIHLKIVQTIDEAMDKYIGKKAPFYIERETISVQTAIEAIHAAGGTAVIAHLGEYNLEGEHLKTFFDYCIEHKIDGFELLHPHNTPVTAADILDFAERFRRETGKELLLTSGSDYHGKNKTNRPGFPWMSEESLRIHKKNT